MQEQTGSISYRRTLLIRILAMSTLLILLILLGGHDSISCEHGSFSEHRHLSNSDMIDMINHWGCSPTILGIAGRGQQRWYSAITGFGANGRTKRKGW